ncbi:hypothetical protein OSB04_028218 [Centaurea solstitialis]|uniref:Uncharacterized protein n=1 Tax=Centaurea solstitialis TaxID=347529 RepID=A0AA38W0E5_9ASTR|nr:hypothetical protein OSB04_028218 [Centaurea solstitialis]
MVSNEFRDEILLTGGDCDNPPILTSEQSFVDKTLHFFEEPVEILDREIKKLKRSKIQIVKVH